MKRGRKEISREAISEKELIKEEKYIKINQGPISGLLSAVIKISWAGGSLIRSPMGPRTMPYKSLLQLRNISAN